MIRNFMRHTREQEICLVLLIAYSLALSSCSRDLAPDLASQRPKITEAEIANDLIDRQIPVSGENNFLAWKVDKTWTKQIAIVQSNYSGDKAAIGIEMKLDTGQRTFIRKKWAGKIRLHYEWM